VPGSGTCTAVTASDRDEACRHSRRIDTAKSGCVASIRHCGAVAVNVGVYMCHQGHVLSPHHHAQM
jgi:hypothetical protein